MGIIKTLKFNEILGYPQMGTTPVYPVTALKAVIDNDGNSLEDIIKKLQEDIRNSGNGEGGSSEGITYYWAFGAFSSDEAAAASLDNANLESDGYPRGWSKNSNVTVQQGEYIYMSTARKKGSKWLVWENESVTRIWSVPARIGGSTTSTTGADGNGYNYMYCRTLELKEPKVPSTLSVQYLEELSNHQQGLSVNGQSSAAVYDVWYDHPQGVSSKYPYEWMLIFKGKDSDLASYELISGPTLWSKYGQDGKDGDGIEYIFKLAKSTDPIPNWNSGYPQCVWEGSTMRKDLKPSDSIYKENDDVIPEGWTDNPEDMHGEYNVQYVSMRKKVFTTNSNTEEDNKKGLWGPFSAPSKWSVIPTVESLNIKSSKTLFNVGKTAGDFNSAYREEADESKLAALGWRVYPNQPANGDQHIFMITAETLNGNYITGEDGYIWSAPIQISYGGSSTSNTGVDVDNIINFIYYRTNTKSSIIGVPQINPDTLEEKWKDANNHNLPFPANGVSSSVLLQEGEEGWLDHPLGIEENAKYEYFSMSLKQTDSWSAWTKPTLWSNWGEKGLDGDGVEYIFCLSPVLVSDTSNLLSNEAAQGIGGTKPEEDDFIPMNPQAGAVLGQSDANQYWSDDPREVSEAYPYQYVSKRKKNQENGQAKWGPFCKPTLWSRYGRDGVVLGYILTCDNDTAILDDNSTDDIVRQATSTEFTLQGSYDTTQYTLKYVLATEGLDQSVLKRNIETSEGRGFLTYSLVAGKSLVKDTTFVTTVNAVLVNNETNQESVVATRRHLIQVIDLNSTGTVYKLLVTPNNISVNHSGNLVEVQPITVMYNEISSTGVTTVKNVQQITKESDINSVQEDHLFYTIRPADSNVLLTSNSITELTNTASYYIVELYYKKQVPILVDIETINCVKEGAPGESTNGADAEFYTVECDTTSIIRNIKNNIASYAPTQINFKCQHIKGNTQEYVALKTGSVIPTVNGRTLDPQSVGTSVIISTLELSNAVTSLIFKFSDEVGIQHQIQLPIANTAQGEQGIQGAVARYRGNWEQITGWDAVSNAVTQHQNFFYNSSDDSDLIKYIDIVSTNVYEGGIKGTKYYKCITTHNTTMTGTAPWEGTYWEEAQEYEFMAVDVLIANAINTTTLSAKDIVILDNDNNVVAGMTSSKPSTQTGLNSSDVGDVRIWAGSTSNNNIKTAPFRVTEEGELTATNAVIKGEVQATNFTAVLGTSYMTFKLWTKEDSENQAHAGYNYKVGTPVLIVHDEINSQDYVVNLQTYSRTTVIETTGNLTEKTVVSLNPGNLVPQTFTSININSSSEKLYMCDQPSTDGTLQLGYYYNTSDHLNPDPANGYYYLGEERIEYVFGDEVSTYQSWEEAIGRITGSEYSEKEIKIVDNQYGDEELDSETFKSTISRGSHIFIYKYKHIIQGNPILGFVVLVSDSEFSHAPDRDVEGEEDDEEAKRRPLVVWDD